MLTKAFVADAAFMGSKFLLETGLLCFLLDLCINRNPGKALRAVGRGAWLIGLSALLQLLSHYLLDWYVPQINFLYRYLFFNGLTMVALHARFLRKQPAMLLTYLSFLLVADVFCQILATFVIFHWKSSILFVTQFQITEQLVSTAIIWLLFALCFCLFYRMGRRIYQIPAKEALYFSSFCWLLFLLSNILCAYYFSSQVYPWAAGVIHLLFLIALCLFYVIAVLMLEEREKATQRAHLLQQYSLQMQHADELKHVYEDLHAVRHEMKNQFLYMQHLLDEGKYDVLRQYFRERNATVLAAGATIDCGNSLVNAILWSKQQSAQHLGIPMSIEAALPAQLPVGGHHLCSLLANLLDNAIDGSRHVRAPRIRVILQMRQNYLFCCVSNRIDSDVLKANPQLRSTKKDAQSHGYGIRNIRDVAKQYSGMTEFVVEDGEFIATVMLQCTPQ